MAQAPAPGLVGLFGLGAIGYEAAPSWGVAPDLVRELPFVTNSVVKVVTLALVCGYVARDLRPRMAMLGPVIAVHWISRGGPTGSTWPRPAPTDWARSSRPSADPLPMRQILWSAIALDGGIALSCSPSITPAGRRGSRASSSGRSSSAPWPRSPRS
jgi:hypothetical protein